MVLDGVLVGGHQMGVRGSHSCCCLLSDQGVFLALWDAVHQPCPGFLQAEKVDLRDSRESEMMCKTVRTAEELLKG